MTVKGLRISCITPRRRNDFLLGPILISGLRDGMRRNRCEDMDGTKASVFVDNATPGTKG